MTSSTWLVLTDRRNSAPRYDREDVRSLLARAVQDPSVAQKLRAGLARSSPGVQTFRLDDREVVRQMVDLVVRGEVVLAPGKAPKAASRELEKYSGKKFENPVKFAGGKWIAVWPIADEPTPGELGFVDSGLDSNSSSTEAFAVFDGPKVAKEMVDKMNEMEEEKKETEKARKEREDQLAEAEKERIAAQKQLDSAGTEDEKSEARAILVNVEEMIKLHKQMIGIHENHLKELKAKGPRAVKILRLHEQTHVDIAAAAAKRANKLLKDEPDPDERERIIDVADEVAADVNQEMDKLLNPGKFGSEEDEKALAEWISKSSSRNYHTSIETQFEQKL